MGFVTGAVSPGVVSWLAAAGAFLMLALAVSTVRRMLDCFSRKALLEGAPPAVEERLSELLLRVDEYASCLRALDHLFRLCLFSSLAFAVLPERGRGRGPAGEAGGFLALLLALLLIVFLFLELLPHVLARLRPEAALRVLLPGLDRLYQLLAPLWRGYSSLIRAGARAVGGEEERPAADLVEEEILNAAEEGEREGILEEGEISMIESIIRFRDKEVSEVMTPRTEMVGIGIEESVEEAVRLSLECGHSRIPVYRENKDNIAGILYVKDLLRFWKAGESVRLADTIRQPHFVPESKKISELFHEFKSQRFHIAIILDEFGGTAGLITIEDIIEEIVGEIVDEFEKVERPEILGVSPGLWEVDARLSIHEANEKLELELPEDDGYDTVGGFVFGALGKVPGVGDSYQFGQARFEVLEADSRKIGRLRIRVAPPAAPAEGEAPGTGAAHAGPRSLTAAPAEPAAPPQPAGSLPDRAGSRREGKRRAGRRARAREAKGQE